MASYLLLTHTVMGSRAAMSIAYCAGVLTGFVLNRKITFGFRGDQAGAAGAIHRQLRNRIRDRLYRPLAAR